MLEKLTNIIYSQPDWEYVILFGEQNNLVKHSLNHDLDGPRVAQLANGGTYKSIPNTEMDYASAPLGLEMGSFVQKWVVQSCF